MKKIILICVCIMSASVSLHAQTAKWFVGFPTGYVFGSPGSTLNSMMSNQGYNQSEDIFFFNSVINYPTRTYVPPLMIMAGKQISKYGSLYILMGQPDASTVTGYNGVAVLGIQYNILQGTLGYQFTFNQSHFKLGIGPSLFVFHYKLSDYTPSVESTQTSPGISLMARLPFGPEKKLFGIELFFAMNVAESVHINDISENVNYAENDFAGGKLSMVSAMLGLNFVLRK